MTENYWDWKLLVNNLMVFSLPLASFVFSRPSILIPILKCWFKYAWIIFVILMPFLSSDAYGRFLVPFTFLALLFPLLNGKYKTLTLIAFLITITWGSASRSDMLKFSVCLLLGFSLLIPYIWKSTKIQLGISYSLMALPIIFFILGATNTFNIFNIEEEFGLEEKYKIKNSKGVEQSALADTRTLLYVEEIQSAIKNDYVLLGRSIARGYDTILLGEAMNKTMNTKRGERPSCETSILNIFNYFGLVGVTIYLIIFLRASFLAISKSKNIFIPIIGLYIAFRWLFAWIEDFSWFDLNYLFLWILIGLCYSPLFRSMSNREFIFWFNKIIK